MVMDENLRLLQKAAEGDRAARDQLVTDNLGLVWSIVRRFERRGYELEDLAQIGCIGLMKAIDKFDLSYEVKFSTYAVPIITGEIKRFLRDDGMIKVSRSLKEMAMKARLATEQLGNQLGREPTLGELSDKLGVGAEELAAALESGAEVESLYQTIYQSEGNDIQLVDRLAEKTDFQEKVLNEMVLEELLEDLTEKEKTLISMRYFQEKTQSQVAAVLGISQVQVSRLEKKILQRLRLKL
jgi:RNA polymerase sporulation-specific sigma factor